MPYYIINHICPLTTSQQDALAERITSIHALRFHTPSLFVNVVFEERGARRAYVGGRKVCRSSIFGFKVRKRSLLCLSILLGTWFAFSMVRREIAQEKQ